jgi:hypothetical protein
MPASLLLEYTHRIDHLLLQNLQFYASFRVIFFNTPYGKFDHFQSGVVLVQLKKQPRGTSISLPLARRKLYDFLGVAERIFWPTKFFVD